MKETKLFPADQPDGQLLSLQANLPQRILVVDRDPFVCHLCADFLIRHGYDVNAAEDGAAGWEELQTNSYHLLITAHDLPKISGVQLIRKVRTARLDVSVVMVASKLPARGLARSPSLQLAATLLKPLLVAALLDTVRAVLRSTDHPDATEAPPSNGPGQPLPNRQPLW